MSEKELKKWVATLLAGALSACGGSSDDPPAKTQLFATTGNATVYRGLWRSDCGSIIVGKDLQGVKFELNVTGAAGNVASGSLVTRSYFSEQSCAGGASPLGTSTATVTLTIESAPTAVDGAYTGQADQVTVASPGTTSATAYFGFVAAKDKFYISSKSTFSALDLGYTKSAP